jgi:hypothetical protein
MKMVQLKEKKIIKFSQDIVFGLNRLDSNIYGGSTNFLQIFCSVAITIKNDFDKMFYFY